mmetsp:Transcript_28531/g.59781  ORF Transcript_28531/g.59781 Transcript_28531/m.59781 type:complete len:83 (-) Transcript_28531:1387-1635(-)
MDSSQHTVEPEYSTRETTAAMKSRNMASHVNIRIFFFAVDSFSYGGSMQMYRKPAFHFGSFSKGIFSSSESKDIIDRLLMKD